MKQIISQLIADFHERDLPELTERNKMLSTVKGKASVVIGMRRTGKTFFCFQKIKELIASGIERENILYLNFEDERLLDFTVKDFQTILDVYYSHYPENRNNTCHFFFDEIQRIDQWEMFIRRLLDTEDIMVCLTGSSSKLLSSEIATSLRGRALSTEIFPFNFQELLQHHKLFEKQPAKIGAKTASKLRKAARAYLSIGGFPEVQKLDANLRVEVLQGYIDSVLLKDIVERHKVGNVSVLKHLVRHIMNSPGGKFSINRFYNTLKSMSIKCTKNNLYDYLDHLIDAYLFYKAPIHSRSEKARMVNPSKMYTIDTGLLNAMVFQNSPNNGPLLENIVFMHLRCKGFEVEYINSKDGFETDFFARHPISGDIKLIQVCWDMSDEKTFIRELRGLKSAMEELAISEGTIVTWDDETLLDGNINIVPVWKWLLM